MKLLIFISIILGTTFFIVLFVLTLSKRPSATDKSILLGEKEKTFGKNRSNKSNENFSSADISEIDTSFQKERNTRKEKYPHTETLTTLLDFDDEDGCSEDFATSLLSEQSITDKEKYSEINFETGSFASAGEVIENNSEMNTENSLEERTAVLENLDINNNPEEIKTSLLFEDENEEEHCIKNDLPTEEKMAEGKNSTTAGNINAEETSGNEDEEGIFDLESEKSADEDKAEDEIESTEDTEDNTLSNIITAPAEAEMKMPSVYQGETFMKTTLDNAENAIFINCKFQDCTLAEKSLKNAKFINVEIQNTSFLGAEMQYVLFDCVKVCDSNFKFASLESARILRSSFSQCNFNKADFQNCFAEENSKFEECSFEKASNLSYNFCHKIM